MGFAKKIDPIRVWFERPDAEFGPGCSKTESEMAVARSVLDMKREMIEFSNLDFSASRATECFSRGAFLAFERGGA